MLEGLQPRPAETVWFYERDGQDFGPTDVGGLQLMADCLHLLPECEVWQRGRSERTLASDVDGIRLPPREPPPAPFDPRYLRLYRSADDRVLLGLCGGLAHRSGMSPLAIRAAVLFLACVMVGLAYPLAIFVPALPTKGRPR